MRTVVAIIVKDQEVLAVGSNEHKGPCGREGYPSGEGYELCEWCQVTNHAEYNAIKGRNFTCCRLLLFGHTYCCDSCLEECRIAGIKDITICEL